MAQYNLEHKFKEQGFPDVAFPLGTTEAIYIGEFLFSDLSTQSNSIVFTFHEQEPNVDDCQKDYLICHLLQSKGKRN
jgi:hypothetical protein